MSPVPRRERRWHEVLWAVCRATSSRSGRSRCCVAKLEFRDIMGYCLLYFALDTLIGSTAFLLLPHLGAS